MKNLLAIAALLLAAVCYGQTYTPILNPILQGTGSFSAVLTGTGSIVLTGSTSTLFGLNSTSYTATIWIDATTGSNSTAQIGQPFLPFSGPVAAQNAATSASLTSVQFVVRPGTYTVAAAIVKPGTMNEEWVAPYGTATFTAVANLNDQILRSANITNSTNTTSGTTSIRVAGIAFNGNGMNQSTGYYPTVWINGETNVVFEHDQFFNPHKYCLLGTNLAYFFMDDLQFNSTGGSNQDGLHLLGPQNGFVGNVTGQTEDDLVAVITDEGAIPGQSWTSNGATVSGDFGRLTENVTVKNIIAINRGSQDVRLRSNSFLETNIKVDTVLGSANTGNPVVTIDTDVSQPSGHSFSAITLANVDSVVQSATTGAEIWVNTNSISDLTVTNLGFHPILGSYSVSGATYYPVQGVLIAPSASLGSLIISGANMDYTVSQSPGGVFGGSTLLANAGYVGNIAIAGAVMAPTATSSYSSYLYTDGGTGTYGALTIANSHTVNTNTAIGLTLTQTGTMRLSNVTMTGANTGSLVTVTSVSAGTVNFANSASDGTGGLIGGLGGTWNANVAQNITTLTVSGLPTATTSAGFPGSTGAQFMVTDSTVSMSGTTVGTTPPGTGSLSVMVVSKGTAFVIP